MQEKFTIEEIRNYLKKSDSFGDAMHFLSAERIIAANINDTSELKEWFISKFDELAEEFSNSEIVNDISISEENGETVIKFTVDHDGYGVHKHSITIDQNSGTVNMCLNDIIEGGDLERELEKALEQKFNN